MHTMCTREGDCFSRHRNRLSDYLNVLVQEPYIVNIISLVHHVHLINMTGSKESKLKFGISINKELVQKIDGIVEQSDYLKLSRSEIIESILWKFVLMNMDEKELAINTVELAIRNRKGELLV